MQIPQHSLYKDIYFLLLLNPEFYDVLLKYSAYDLTFSFESADISSIKLTSYPVSILYKSIADRYRPVSYPDGPITARYRFIKNAYWVSISAVFW